MTRLSQKQSWSREVAVIRKQAGAEQQAQFLTPEKRAMLLLALKTAMAAGISYGIALMAGFADGYWGSISAIIVLQSNVGSTVTASRDRLLGTLIGAFFGAVFSIFGEGIWIYLLAVVIAMITCSLLGLKNSSRLAGVTVTILMLVHRTGSGFWSNWILPMHRVGEVLLGIVVALLIATFVFPSRARARLRDGLAQEFLLLSSVFNAIMEELQGAPAARLEEAWREAEASEEANVQLLSAARNEPATGSIALESLSFLHQSARELIEALHALHLATKSPDVRNDGRSYLAELEPEIRALTLALYNGFESLARTIHHWKFEMAATSQLEESVAKLEAKMALIRPRMLEFPQQEIFRVYAVQLHLKQIARLLQSAPIEAPKALS
ncbi:MAG TPA: FUSC family protein [Acidobacteriaceae bacterium]|nr:FUSC family protein [Acidobacteriaceae bacterium]